MRSSEKLNWYQKIEWDSPAGMIIAAISIEALVLAVFSILHTYGDLGLSYFFFNIWIFVTAFINLLLTILLIAYRPKLWYAMLLPLLLLPVLPYWWVIADFGYLFLEIVKSLNR